MHNPIHYHTIIQISTFFHLILLAIAHQEWLHSHLLNNQWKQEIYYLREEHLDTLADLALADFAHPNNPKPVSREDFRTLYSKAL